MKDLCIRTIHWHTWKTMTLHCVQQKKIHRNQAGNTMTRSVTFLCKDVPEAISYGDYLHLTVCGGDVNLLTGRDRRRWSRGCLDYHHILVQGTYV